MVTHNNITWTMERLLCAAWLKVLYLENQYTRNISQYSLTGGKINSCSLSCFKLRLPRCPQGQPGYSGEKKVF